MKKKKIVFISLSVGNYNGVFLNDLIKKTHGYAEIYVIYCSQYERFMPKTIANYPKLIKVKGINIFNNVLARRIIKSPDSVITYFAYYKNLNKILEEISPDVIQTSLYFMPYSWQAYLYCSKKNIPLLINEEIQREPTFIVTRMLNRIGLLILRKTLLKKASYVISATKRGIEFQGKFLANKNKVVQIPWPVEEEKFLKLKRIESNSKTLNLLAVARLVPYKDFDTIITAMSKLKENGIAVHLTIRGSGPSEAIIRKRLSSNGLERYVDIVPEISFEEVKKLYLSSDLLILASKYEPYGMVIPEAMACGCGIIISDTCGTSFMIEDDKNGYIFKTGDANDLAKKIELSRGKIKEFGNYSRHLMKTQFSKGRILEEYINLLKKVGL